MKYALVAFWLTLMVGTVALATIEPSVTNWIVERARQPAPDLPCWYILTGGVSVGKSTQIQHLKSQGHTVVEEAAKAFILSEQAKGVLEPWKAPAFQASISACIDADMDRVKKLEPVDCFWDRGPFDSIAFCLHRAQEPPKEVIELTQKALREAQFQLKVFILEELSVFENTAYRPEGREESMQIAAWIEKSYAALGFTVVKIPAMSVEERTQFILQEVAADKIPAKEKVLA